MISRRHLLQGTAAITLASVNGAAWAQTKSPGRISIAMFGEPPTLQMAINTAAVVQLISAKIHSGLLTYDGDFAKPKPNLAESWEIAPDGKTITFHLKQGVLWHDGKPFSSADVKFTIEEVIKKHHSRGRITFANLDAVETPDANTAIFRLKQPAPYIMVALHSSETPIVPKHIYENTDILGNPNNNAPIGTGPFKFKEWKRGSYVLLERNEKYFRPGEPKLDQIVFTNISDAGARSVALESGELDIGAPWPVPLADMQRFETVKNVSITTEGYTPFGPMTFFEFNLNLPMFQNKQVRKAIAHCIDRTRIIDTIYCGYAKAATGPINSKMPGGFYSDAVTQYKYDLKTAENMLDEAGVKRGAGGVRFSFTLEPAPWSPQFPQLAEYIAQSLGRVGIKVEVRVQDAATWIKRAFTTREAQAIVYATFNMMDPTLGVQRQYSSATVGVIFGNGSGYSNPKIDELFAKAQNDNDQQERVRIFADIQKILTDDVPNIPLTEEHYATIYNKRIMNMTAGLLGPYDDFGTLSTSS
jgi:peptide/nickel transport system substrate-binding protein